MLQTSAEGIIVTYTEQDDLEVLFDTNGGVWTETSSSFHPVSENTYAIYDDQIVNNAYKPSDPTRSGKVFLGWTTNPDIAGQTDFSSTSAVMLRLPGLHCLVSETGWH